jgi:hypothetical protein
MSWSSNLPNNVTVTELSSNKGLKSLLASQRMSICTSLPHFTIQHNQQARASSTCPCLVFRAILQHSCFSCSRPFSSVILSTQELGSVSLQIRRRIFAPSMISHYDRPGVFLTQRNDIAATRLHLMPGTLAAYMLRTFRFPLV